MDVCFGIERQSEIPQLYNENILSLVDDIWSDARHYHGILGTDRFGVSYLGVIGSVLEEFNDRNETLCNQLVQSGVDELGKVLLAASTIVNSLTPRQQYETIRDGGRLENQIDNLWRDFGIANIDLYTAVRLLDGYNEMYPSSDPLDLKKYNSDYFGLISDLVSREDYSTSLAFASLMIHDAASWYSINADNWADLDQINKEGLTVFFYNYGLERIEVNAAESRAAIGEYRPEIIGEFEGLLIDDIFSDDPASTLIAIEYVGNRRNIIERLEGLGVQEPFVEPEYVDFEKISLDFNYIVPNILVSDAIASEGETLIFFVTLTASPSTEVRFDAQTYLNGTDGDYEGGRQSFSFSAFTENLVQPVEVVTVPDDEDEGTEVMYVALENISGALVGTPEDRWGTGTIMDVVVDGADGQPTDEQVETGPVTYPGVVGVEEQQTTGGSNVAITAFGAASSGASSGTFVDVTYTVTNLGDERTAANRVDIVIAGSADLQTGRQVGETFDVPELEPGESRTYTRTADLPSTGNGDFFLGATVRSRSLGHNSDESDDSLATPFVIGPGLSGAPDLLPFFTFDSNIFRPTSVYEATYTVRANAFGSPEFDHALVLSRDDIFSSDDLVLHSGVDDGLGRSGEARVVAEFTIPETIEDGLYHLIAVADASGSVTERNEENNTREMNVVVSRRLEDDNNLTNIVASHVEITADVLNVNERYQFNDHTYTDSFEDVPPLDGDGRPIIYDWMLYLSEDNIPSVDDVPLRGSQSVLDSEIASIDDSRTWFTIPAWVQSGEYYIYFRADIFDDIPEDDENDNTSALTPITILNSTLPSVQAQRDEIDVELGSSTSVNITENDLIVASTTSEMLNISHFEGLGFGSAHSQVRTHSLGFSYEISRDGTLVIDASDIEQATQEPVKLHYEVRGGSAAESSLGLVSVYLGGRQLEGSNFNDALTGGTLADTITGFAGNDRLIGLAGNDSIIGGTGADTLIGSAGNDTLDGGFDDDALNGGVGADHLIGNRGADFIDGGDGSDVIQLGGDSYHGAGYVAYNVSSDTQAGTHARINIEGYLRIEGVVNGGLGRDEARLTNDDDAFFLHDAYSGFHSSVTLAEDYVGNLSAARIDGIEVIWALDGNDIIDLTSPDYNPVGQSITIYGGEGNDIIWGSEATELIDGGIGNDTLFGGTGGDTLIGGEGADVFEFTATSDATTIDDLNAAEDAILLYFTDGRRFDPDQNAISVVNDTITVEYMDVPDEFGNSDVSSYSILLGENSAPGMTSGQILDAISIF